MLAHMSSSQDSPSEPEHRPGKLAGLTVIDLSQFLPGPFVTMMMADHGARVIKVEMPGAGEPSRHIGPSVAGHTVYFRNTQRGKESVALDLKSADGHAALLALVRDADVLVESFRPGVAKRLGIDYEAIAAIAPRLVYCSISAFGQTGPWSDRPAHDLSVQALAGTLSLGKTTTGEVAMPGCVGADMAGSLTALSGILMALVRAKDTGLGDYVDIGMHDALLAFQPHATLTVFAHDAAPVPSQDRLFGGSALYRLYRTNDGRWITLGGSEEKFVRNLLTALDRPDLIELGLAPPGNAQRRLHEFLERTFASRKLDEWVAWFADKDVCFAPVLDMKEAIAQPHAIERGAVILDAEGHRHLGNPIHFQREPARPRFEFAEIGQHGQPGSPHRDPDV
jgi:crotonobetainyl-CoA:carnitine CoA-transferase CaiB-like acyl-CoA transferase